jgi:hypothetical protein
MRLFCHQEAARVTRSALHRSYLCPGEPVFGGWWACQSGRESKTWAYLMDNLGAQRTLGTEVETETNRWDVAYPLQIRWKAADRVSITSSTSSAIVTAAGRRIPSAVAAATQTRATASSPEPSATSQSSTGLSTGAKVGIGVGVGLVGLIVVIAGVWWCLRRRRMARGYEEGRHGALVTSHQVRPKVEIDGYAVANRTGPPGELWAPSKQVFSRPGCTLVPQKDRIGGKG